MNTIKQYPLAYLIGAILLLLLAGLINPLQIVALTELRAVITVLFALLFGTLLGLMWLRRPLDEREQGHVAYAGFAAFASGGITLVIAMLVQISQGRLDEWLPITLLIMLSVQAIVITLFSIRR